MPGQKEKKKPNPNNDSNKAKQPPKHPLPSQKTNLNFENSNFKFFLIIQFLEII